MQNQILKKPVVVIDAPSNLGLRPPQPNVEPGTKYAPDALRKAGILEAFDAVDGGRVEPPPYSFDFDKSIGIRNVHAIRDYSRMLADRIGGALDAGQFPVVLGGDCSILIGAGVALKRRAKQRYGLIFIDGHSDFQLPKRSRTGGAAGMDCAIVTGHGHELLTDIDGLFPYFQEGDVVIFGNRDIEDIADYYAPELFDTAVSVVPLDDIRKDGMWESILRWVEWSKRKEFDGVWVHLDVDAINLNIMSAVDSPMTDGLTQIEMIQIFRHLFWSERCVGMDITIYDPTLDPDGRMARTLVETLEMGLGNMRLFENQRNQVIAQIETAFAEQKAPTYREDGNRDDACRFSAYFYQTHWRDITPEALFIHRSSLIFFSLDYFAFYLPTFLLAVLRAPEKMDTLTHDIANSLGFIMREDRIYDRYEDVLTVAEIQAVLSFLDVYRYIGFVNDGWGMTSRMIPEIEHAKELWQKALATKQAQK